MGDLHTWVKDELHNVLGYSDESVASFCVSIGKADLVATSLTCGAAAKKATSLSGLVDSLGSALPAGGNTNRCTHARPMI